MDQYSLGAQNLMQNLGSEASSAEEATMAELERVLYAQMLILFAPHAVPAIAHVPLLLATLGSRQPGLRKAAADTLRHLAGTNYPWPLLWAPDFCRSLQGYLLKQFHHVVALKKAL